MPNAPPVFPSPEEASRLHQRLVAGDPTASNDLAVAYLEPLIAWLSTTNRRVAPDVHEEAAEDAILALIRNPSSYKPHRQSLAAYLRMSARGDLRNHLRKEQKHRQGRVSWQSVELSADAGKYLGRQDAPVLELQVTEQLQVAASAIPEAVRDGLTEAEGRVLQLMLQQERRTAVYAEAYGILHLPPTEQRREVKRVKDRLKLRLKRARGDR